MEELGLGWEDRQADMMAMCECAKAAGVASMDCEAMAEMHRRWKSRRGGSSSSSGDDDDSDGSDEGEDDD